MKYSFSSKAELMFLPLILISGIQSKTLQTNTYGSMIISEANKRVCTPVNNRISNSNKRYVIQFLTS